MSESPFVQFYPSDWLAGTRGLSAAETGIYITLIAMMYEREAPLNMSADRLARLCGATKPAFEKALAALTDQGKIDATDAGLWNGRVEIELKKRAEKRESAKASVSARWKKTKQNQQNDDTNVIRTPYETDTNQIPEPEKKDSDTDVSDGEAVAEDFAKQLFDRAVVFLGRHGTGEKQARSFVGKLRKAYRDPDILAAFVACGKAGAVDPIPWITAKLGKPKTDLDAAFAQFNIPQVHQ